MLRSFRPEYPRLRPAHSGHHRHWLGQRACCHHGVIYCHMVDCKVLIKMIGVPNSSIQAPDHGHGFFHEDQQGNLSQYSCYSFFTLSLWCFKVKVLLIYAVSQVVSWCAVGFPSIELELFTCEDDIWRSLFDELIWWNKFLNFTILYKSYLLKTNIINSV